MCNDLPCFASSSASTGNGDIRERTYCYIFLSYSWFSCDRADNIPSNSAYPNDGSPSQCMRIKLLLFFLMSPLLIAFAVRETIRYQLNIYQKGILEFFFHSCLSYWLVRIHLPMRFCSLWQRWKQKEFREIFNVTIRRTSQIRKSDNKFSQ